MRNGVHEELLLLLSMLKTIVLLNIFVKTVIHSLKDSLMHFFYFLLTLYGIDNKSYKDF